MAAVPLYVLIPLFLFLDLPLLLFLAFFPFSLLWSGGTLCAKFPSLICLKTSLLFFPFFSLSPLSEKATKAAALVCFWLLWWGCVGRLSAVNGGIE